MKIALATLELLACLTAALIIGGTLAIALIAWFY